MEDAEDATAAMAQAMGFSSFGTQNPNKRRKFNAHADAVVASTSASTSVVREAKSGSNTIPLGVRVRNEDEINLDSDGEEAGASNSEVRNHPGDNGDDGNPEQHNSDASYPRVASVADSTDDIQSKIDAITGDFPQVLGTQSSSTSTRGGHYSRGDYQQGRGRREPGRKWWEDYYDPRWNVNPWERLERARGLSPIGSWMSWEEAKRGTSS